MTSEEQELARRKIYQAMIEQGMTPDQQQVVSGRVVPYSPIQGLSKLAQAYLGRSGLDKMDKTAAERQGLERGAISDYLKTSQGVPETDYKLSPEQQFDNEQIPGLKNAGIEADPNKAMQDYAANPNARQSILDALIAKQMGIGKTPSDPYSTLIVGPEGELFAFNTRNESVKPLNMKGGKYNPETTAANAAAGVTGKVTAENKTAPLAADTARQVKVGEITGVGQGTELTAQQMADAAAKKAAAETSAKVNAEAGTKLANSADKFNSYYDEAISLLSQDPTESGLGAAFDAAGSFVGYTPKGAATQDALKVVAGNLTGLVPRFEGPQSDKDTALYKEMAAEVGSNKPVERRLKALQTMKKLMDENIKGNTFKGFIDKTSETTGKKEVSRKVKNGITIIKYSDGTYGQE